MREILHSITTRKEHIRFIKDENNVIISIDNPLDNSNDNKEDEWHPHTNYSDYLTATKQFREERNMTLTRKTGTPRMSHNNKNQSKICADGEHGHYEATTNKRIDLQ